MKLGQRKPWLVRSESQPLSGSLGEVRTLWDSKHLQARSTALPESTHSSLSLGVSRLQDDDRISFVL